MPLHIIFHPSLEFMWLFQLKFFRPKFCTFFACPMRATQGTNPKTYHSEYLSENAHVTSRAVTPNAGMS
jgi:hypothetical protein